MPFDFITSEPNASPTQGQDEAATPTRFDQSSLLDIAKANVGEDSAELSDWLAKQAYNNAERDIANGGDPRQYQTLDPRVAPEQLRKEYPSVAGINEALPRSIVQDMQRAQQRKEAMASADAGYQKTWANLPLRFGAGAITSMLDPVDDAAFMVPVVGEARYGAWLAKAGTAGGVAGRLAVTAGVGGLRGAVGGAILDVAKDGMNGGDVSLGDIATDALQNAVAGSLMHTAHGFHSDVMGTRFAETPEGQAAAGNADLHDNATRVAAAQMADDRPVDVRPVFDMARPQMSRADLMGSTAIDRVMPSYFDDAIQRAAGRPTQEAMIAEDVSQQAKATAPEQVLDGRAAEAERAINDLRTTGKLTPEEEAELAQYEPEQKVTASNEPKAATEAVKEGELFNNEPEHANLAGAMASPDEQVAGGLPHVMGGPDFRLAHTDTAITSSGREVPVQYAVVDAGHLTASHDADGNVNPQYPAELQPRDRARGTSSAQISKIAATLDPRLLMETPKASDGAPIVSPEGVVESGNGRTLAIRRAYSEHPEVAAKYRDALAARGYDVSGMGSPMLVRVRTGDMAENDIEAFTREANARDTLAYSATEQAQADARALPDHSLDLYRGGDIDAASNREFVKAFMTHAVPSAEHGSMVSADGALSQQAIQRIRAALLAKAYGDTDLISSIVESTDSNTKAIGGALTDVAGAWAKMRQGVRDGHVDPDMDITPHILDAVRLVERARKDGESIKGLVNQRDMFTGEAVDPLTEAVLRLMFNRDDFTSPVGRARLAQALSKYTDEATKASPGPDLLGLSTKAKPSDILSVAKGRTPDEHAQQDLLRPAIGAGESTGHPDGDGERRAGEIVPADGSDETARDERADGSLTPEAPKDATKIEDFGEHLIGARKDYAISYKERMEHAGEVNVAAEPLSKSWPDPDYKKLIEGGAGSWAVSAARVLRDEVPAKPQRYGLKDWAGKVTMMRDLAQRVLYGDIDKATLLSKLNDNRALRNIANNIDLYEAVGHDNSLKGISLQGHQYSVYGGVRYNPGKIVWTVERPSKSGTFGNWPRIMAEADTKQEVIDAFKAKVSEGALIKNPAKDTKFEIYSKRGQPGFWIGKKIGKSYADLKHFDDVKSARNFRYDSKAELLSMLEKYKDIPPERRATNSPRIGENYRNGADISPEKFGETFKFRGVQFGNYVEGLRRQADLNETFDALHDMAGVLGVSPGALSLDGKLGLAFGARGKGGKGAAAAHYEPGTVVINLTKNAGAGSLGHEWWHALDNYFSKQAETPRTEYLSESRGPVLGVRTEMVGAFQNVMKAIRETGMEERSRELDKRRTSAYWATDREMAARAFESYLINRLADHEHANDYLANVVSEKAYGLDEGYPYLTAGEIPAVRDAFDHLFETMQEESTPNGVRLYSRQDEGGQRFEAARSDITNRLKQVGLQGKVALDVVDSLGGPAGMYHQNMITIAMDGPSAMGALDHEIIHAVRDAFHPAEWSALSRAAMADGNLMASVERRYPDLDRNGQTEEAVADMFSRFAREDRQPKGLIAAAFNRIKNLFQSIGNALRGQGFTTADDVMRAVSGGEIGARVGEPRDIAEPLGGAVYHDDGDVAKYSRSDADAANDQAEPFSAAKMDAATLAKQKLTAMQDIAKRHAMFDKIQQIKEGGLTLAHGFDALTRGISEAVPGARDSTAQHQLANQEFLMSRLVSNLDKVPGAMEAWRSRALTAEWVRELSELNKKNGQPGISKSPLALEIAKAVHDAQDIARLNLNRAGAWVGDYEGYVSRTQHDAIKIHNAGFENWQHDVLAGVDQAKTFEDMGADEREDFLRNMWDALSTGVHMSADHGADPKAAAFPGPGNMAKKASAGRVLHWTDADAWRNYQEKYGDPVIERGVMERLHRAGRDTALIERWGSNPKMAFENLIQQTRQTYRSDHDAIAKLDKALPRLREEFAHLTGEASRPQSALASQIRGSILALQDITKLGNVLLAHLSTTLTKPFQLQYLGVGRWKAYTSVMSNLIKDNTPEGHEILENLRANATGQFQEMIGGYEPVDGVPGQLARLRQFSMRIGGLPWMLGRQKAGTMWEVANFLGQSIGKSFSQLDERTARGLSIYGVTPAEWDALRMAPNHDADAAGSVYLTPAAAMRANVDALASDRLARAVDPVDADRIRTETRDRLAMKLAAYYGDAAERSTVTPGIQERAFFSRHAGRTWGPMVGQYKGWAMAAVRTMWGQSIHGSNSKAEAVKYLAELGAVGMAVGYARLAITSAANGMTPATFTGEPKHDVSLMSQAMLAGGALGIWGDYLMGQYAKQGESAGDRAKDLALNLLGPAFSDMATTYGLAHEYGAVPFADDSDEAWHKADADGAHFLTSHLPVVNTFYLRLLSRWLFIDRLNEMADPGYLQRHQDAVKEHAGQDFWLPPTQYAGAAA